MITNYDKAKHDSEAPGETVFSGMTDVEILRVTKVNVIARGRRHGKWWLLKGLRKEQRDSAVARRRLQKEFEIHSRLFEPGVVKAVGFENLEGLGNCLVEEWIEGDTLAELLREGLMTKEERRRILHELIRTVGYIHERGVIHRDLKPANIMIGKDGGKVVLIDFGLADTADYAELKGGGGTEGYISPEQSLDGEASVSDDIYSLGKIIGELCPEYTRIGQRCTGSLKKRPKDIKCLSALIARREKLPKRMGIFSGIAAGICLLGIAYGYAIHLDTKAQGQAAEVGLLSEKNTETLSDAAQLQDSLIRVAALTVKASEDIDRLRARESSRQRAYDDGCRRVDMAIEEYKRRIYPVYPADIVEYKKGEVTFKEYMHKSDVFFFGTFDPVHYPGLSEEDIELIKKNIWTYVENRCVLNWRKWGEEVGVVKQSFSKSDYFRRN